MDEWEEQDERISELERVTPPPQTGLTGLWERHDWRPCWELISEISANFKGLRYPTPQQRQAAWERYSALRDEANRRCENERSGFRGQSEWYRDSVLDRCKGIIWSAATDDLFFFDRTTADQVRGWGGDLHEATQYFAEIKYLLLKEHRIQCCEMFDEVRESHRLFWQRYNEAKEKKNEERHNRKQNQIERTRANLQTNNERLEKAQSAKERVQSHMEETQAKLDETNSEKWTGIFQQWIDEDQQKIEDIDASIERIRSWIEEDERRLRELEE
jgi:hypothetical protein